MVKYTTFTNNKGEKIMIWEGEKNFLKVTKKHKHEVKNIDEKIY